MLHFDKVSLEGWRQFDRVDIDLSAQSTVVTGANGCGKTSLLTVLSHHFGWHIHFVSAPFLSRKEKRKLFSDFRRRRATEDVTEDPTRKEVGRVTYSDASECTLLAPATASTNPQYQLEYQRMKQIDGLFIPSHRPAISYQPVSQIPANPQSNQQLYQEYQTLLLQTYGSANVRNPGLVQKQSIIGLALFGYGNEAVAPNEDYRRIFEEFQRILSKLLPESIGFERLEVRMPDVVLVTKSGEFAIDAMSGGVNAVFAMAWQIHLYGADKEACTVLIDEPENHLHPSMQRSLLPNLESAFPNYRFVVATHSPFIVSSNPRANVFALTFNREHRIHSQHLETADLAASPDKVLREVLDVPSTAPIWVEDRIRTILNDAQQEPITREKLESIYVQLKTLGLSPSLPEFSRDRGGSK